MAGRLNNTLLLCTRGVVLLCVRARARARWCRLTQSEAMWRFRCACLWPYIAAPDRGHPGSSGMGTGSCGSWLQACRVLSHGTLVCNSMGIVNGLECAGRAVK